MDWSDLLPQHVYQLLQMRYCCSGDATQTGKIVEQLQKVLPRAKVIYSSATGASEPNNLVCC